MRVQKYTRFPPPQALSGLFLKVFFNTLETWNLKTKVFSGKLSMVRIWTGTATGLLEKALMDGMFSSKSPACHWTQSQGKDPKHTQRLTRQPRPEGKSFSLFPSKRKRFAGRTGSWGYFKTDDSLLIKNPTLYICGIIVPICSIYSFCSFGFDSFSIQWSDTSS